MSLLLLLRRLLMLPPEAPRRRAILIGSPLRRALAIDDRPRAQVIAVIRQATVVPS